MHEQLLSTPLFAVERREFAQPQGPPVTRDVVVHPGAVVVLPILDDGRIVTIRNFRYAVQQELCELPAGTMDPGEAPIDTARRELQEETGYRAGVMTPLMAFFTSPGILTERMHAFLARELTHVGQRLQEGERITVELVNAADLRRGLIGGELRDGKTLAVIGRYLLELDHGRVGN